MTISNPYKRTVRQHVGGSYSEGGKSNYVVHLQYADSPDHYVRAFLLIQGDLLKLFDYIEPSDINLDTYSFRIHELLMRTCIEIEANFKAILSENGYTKLGNLNIGDYRKTDVSHRLSSYTVKMPIWQGDHDIWQLFESWRNGEPLEWYQAYNASKHDRHQEFSEASFEHLIGAICGLTALLSAQFYTHDFSPGDDLLAGQGSLYYSDGMESAIGDYLRIRFPDDWDEEELYEFDWRELREQENPFQTFDYNALP